VALDVSKFRKLVALDEDDPLSRFVLGQALFQEASSEVLHEAAEHLMFANAPDHLATYHVLGLVLIKSGRNDEARAVLEVGFQKASGVTKGMGQDFGPEMAKLLETL